MLKRGRGKDCKRVVVSGGGVRYEVRRFMRCLKKTIMLNI